MHVHGKDLLRESEIAHYYEEKAHFVSRLFPS